MAAMVLAAALFLVAVSAVSAVGEVSLPRSLLQFGKEEAFPYCRCKDYKYSSSPYDLLLTNTTVAGPPGYGEFCFTIAYQGDDASGPGCYQKLAQSLDKITFGIQPACRPAFDASGRYLTVGGKKKSSSWRIKEFPAGGTLELYNMKLDKGADGVQVCMRAAAPCDLPENFFDTLPVTWAVMESSKHECCPSTTTRPLP